MTRKKVAAIATVLVLVTVAVYAFVRSRPTTLVLTGIVTTNDVVVSPQVAGQLGQLLVAEGDVVKKGQLLAVIAPDELGPTPPTTTQSAEGLSSQVRESEAALRFQERRRADQIRQAESTLAVDRGAGQGRGRRPRAGARSPTTAPQSWPRRAWSRPQDLDAGADGRRRGPRPGSTRSRSRSRRSARPWRWRASSAEQVGGAAQPDAGQPAQRGRGRRAARQGRRAPGLHRDRAPIDGIVDVRAARAGEFVSRRPAGRHADQPRRPVGPRRRRGDATSTACAWATR